MRQAATRDDVLAFFDYAAQNNSKINHETAKRLIDEMLAGEMVEISPFNLVSISEREGMDLDEG